MNSVVYVVGGEGLASVKIGTSTRPEQRISQLQTGLPITLTILATFPGDARLERALHEHFAPYRTRGEWFDFTLLGDPVQVVRDAVEEIGPTVASMSSGLGARTSRSVPLARKPQGTTRETVVTVSDDEEWGLGELVLRESVATFDASGTRTSLSFQDRALSDAFPERRLPAGLRVQPWALAALEADGWTLATLRNRLADPT
ncbi:GIY-YIG nuclease family protein [Streptomyces sp. bgisy060]|uniref:GIY-YIG nuclease family protein n=1 Tax=Streptomyces sp. bgisy060 TaxID=3413775 RepID=UPI003EBC6DDF